jgi:hypothetical protein
LKNKVLSIFSLLFQSMVDISKTYIQIDHCILGV